MLIKFELHTDRGDFGGVANYNIKSYMAGATAVILLSLVLVGLHAELRFHDAELMRSHHSHEPANSKSRV